MGKAERSRNLARRERIAAQQAAAQRAERRRRMLIASGSVAVVLVLVVAIPRWPDWSPTFRQQRSTP
jgi:hypothetical protein